MQKISIKIWGCRGSIPVSGGQYCKYGGDTTTIQLKAGPETIIIDAGTGIRRLGNALYKCSDFHILFTHTHYDHIVAFPFFKPIFNKNKTLYIYSDLANSANIEELLAKAINPPYFPVPFSNIRSKNKYIKILGKPFKVGDVLITPVPINHPNGGTGYIFNYHGKKISFFTDNELMVKIDNGLEYDDYVDICMNSDLIIHDAMYTENEYRKRKMWGHSTYEDALKLAIDSKAKTLIFFHHSPERTDKELDDIKLYYSKIKGLIIETAFQDMEFFL